MGSMRSWTCALILPTWLSAYKLVTGLRAFAKYELRNGNMLIANLPKTEEKVANVEKRSQEQMR